MFAQLLHCTCRQSNITMFVCSACASVVADAFMPLAILSSDLIPQLPHLSSARARAATRTRSSESSGSLRRFRKKRGLACLMLDPVHLAMVYEHGPAWFLENRKSRLEAAALHPEQMRQH